MISFLAFFILGFILGRFLYLVGTELWRMRKDAIAHGYGGLRDAARHNYWKDKDRNGSQ